MAVLVRIQESIFSPVERQKEMNRSRPPSLNRERRKDEGGVVPRKVGCNSSLAFGVHGGQTNFVIDQPLAPAG